MGFSAGGHLAARLVHESGVAKPFATITLIYPAYLEGSGSLNPDVAPPPVINSRVFVLIGDQEKPEWVAGARAYVTAAQENHQEGEFHLLSATKHGFGIQPGQVGVVAEWPALLVKFLAGARG
jgi:acetyl esterase/lipase